MVVSTFFPRCYRSVWVGMWLFLVLMALALIVLPVARADVPQLLDESEYRSELEEVVVVGKDLGWRQREQKDQWRPDRFKLSVPSSKSRMQWFPEYTKDERDNYNGVRDRTGEKPQFQIFNWKF